MSYVRWGEDGSGVYVFENIAGQIECHCCSMAPPAPGIESTMLDDEPALLEHLRSHVAAGDTVPGWLLERLAPLPDPAADRRLRR